MGLAAAASDGRAHHSAEDSPSVTTSRLAHNTLTIALLTSPHLSAAIGIPAFSPLQAFCLDEAATDRNHCFHATERARMERLLSACLAYEASGLLQL